MISWRKLFIIAMVLTIVDPLFGVAKRLVLRLDAKQEQLYELADEGKALDQKLTTLGADDIKDPAIQDMRRELTRFQAGVDRLLEKVSDELKWSWWDEVLKPIFALLFLWYCIKNKNFMTECHPVRAGEGEPTK